MAVYRQIHTSFWQDDFILSLTPEQKYFYLYLMTNSKTTQCGIYPFSKKVAVFETGYNMDTIEKLLTIFISDNRITYDESTDEILINNWLKYNPIKGPKMQKCVASEFKQIKSEVLKAKLDTLCIPHIYPMHTPYKPHGEEEEKEEEEEQEEEQEKEEEKVTVASPVIHSFTKEIHPPTPIEFERICDWVDEVSEDVVILAIGQAAYQNKRNMAYINGILNAWKNDGIKTKEGAEARIRDRTGKQDKPTQFKVTNAHYSGQRENNYNDVFVDLEDGGN